MALGLSQSALAKKTGQKRQYIWGWENGKSLPTADKLPGLADALGISIDDLLRKQLSA
ncbi:MAG: helix-turn-helix transcriptional regulator [Candidatus Eremiobacteraeota bacterium]|nr:helix-turn-helix transcriptional regulator [Candidatus Eremiobacteraeota bacterium]